jgi:TetR/AcrR family transcriptional regulator, transcriptional repressor for nem operon
MRYGADHKSETRKRILDRSGALLRKAGVSGLAVKKAMEAAGLTVGGFYNHFESQQRFLAETLKHTLARSRARLFAAEPIGSTFLESFVRMYLSRAHRDGGGAECPLPATLSELPQAGRPAQEALGEEVEAILGDLSARLPGGRQQAIGVFALCVGGLTLARALGASALSDEVLQACRRQLIPPR